MWGVDINEFYDVTRKNEIDPYWGITRRAMLQSLGQMAKTHFGEDYWIHGATKTLKNDANVVFTDVRFNREAEYLRGLGGVIVEVQRQGAGLTGVEGADVSERGISPNLIHLRIQNDGDMTQIEEGVVELMQKLRVSK